MLPGMPCWSIRLYYHNNNVVQLFCCVKCSWQALGRETPNGWMPRYDDIDWNGLNFSREQFEELQAFDRVAWQKEVMQHEELFLLLHDHLPPEMIYERELLICRL
jgi:phosphoenolpyruvate carboxykinase (GTP)